MRTTDNLFLFWSMAIALIATITIVRAKIGA